MAHDVENMMDRIAVTIHEQISANMEGISTVSKQTASSAQKSANAVDQLNNEALSLCALVDQFKL